MRKLSAGDIHARLGRIEKSSRSSRWRKRARAKLLQQVDGYLPEGGHIIELAGGRYVCLKYRYPTLAKAEAALALITANLDHRGESRAYYCWRCSQYHLTSKEYVSHEQQENYRQERPETGRDRGEGFH